jgi:hypothetical protein
VIECEPTASVEILKVVLPLLRVPVPSVVDPSLNVTIPVAAVGDNVAVNVTEVPYPEGFTDEVSVVVVLVLAIAGAGAKEKRAREDTKTNSFHVFRRMNTPLSRDARVLRKLD